MFQCQIRFIHVVKKDLSLFNRLISHEQLKYKILFKLMQSNILNNLEEECDMDLLFENDHVDCISPIYDFELLL